jgi:hypothetical protein
MSIPSHDHGSGADHILAEGGQSWRECCGRSQDTGSPRTMAQAGIFSRLNVHGALFWRVLCRAQRESPSTVMPGFPIQVVMIVVDYYIPFQEEDELTFCDSP